MATLTSPCHLVDHRPLGVVLRHLGEQVHRGDGIQQSLLLLQPVIDPVIAPAASLRGFPTEASRKFVAKCQGCSFQVSFISPR